MQMSPAFAIIACPSTFSVSLKVCLDTCVVRCVISCTFVVRKEMSVRENGKEVIGCGGRGSALAFGIWHYRGSDWLQLRCASLKRHCTHSPCLLFLCTAHPITINALCEDPPLCYLELHDHFQSWQPFERPVALWRHRALLSDLRQSQLDPTPALHMPSQQALREAQYLLRRHPTLARRPQTLTQR